MTRRIPISGRRGAGLYAIVDECDYPRMSQYRWFVDRWGYAYRTACAKGRGKNVKMHREILDVEPGQQVDHANRDTLDNRRENIRPCTPAQNNANSAYKSSSGYRGVYPEGAKWSARIWVNRRGISLGSYASKEEAARAYNRAALLHYGVFATLNEVCPEGPSGSPSTLEER